MIGVSRSWGLSVLAAVLAAGLSLSACGKKEESAEKPSEEMGAPAPATEEAKPAEAPKAGEEPGKAMEEGTKEEGTKEVAPSE